MLLLDRHSATPGSTGPQQGVIDDARRRQRRRRKRTACALLCAGLIAGVVWSSSGGARSSQTPSAGPGSARAVLDAGSHRPGFNVRLVPMLNVVGMAGWCEVIEEHGITRGSACGGIATASQPFLQILGSSEGGCPGPPWRSPGCRRPTTETQIAVTDPQITAILVDGHTLVKTAPLPGLPYGLRGARVVSRVGAKLQALNALGLLVPQTWSQQPHQATVQRWRYPSRPSRAACQLQARGLRGLGVIGGQVATTVRPFAGQLIGRAFLPCAATEYVLQGVPLQASVALDAAQPGAPPADLPSFHAVRGEPGIFAGGSLTAMRSGNAWIVAEQGRDVRQRILALRHLSATVRTGR
jgi:hypothetical protein